MQENETTKKQFRDWPEGVVPPEGLEIKFITMENPFMQKAFLYAMENAFEDMTITSSALVKDGKLISLGINGDGFHQREQKCLRAGLPAGTDYEICPGCRSDNHSERVAIRKAQEAGTDVSGAEIYLYGHWWSCQSCMNAAHKAGIKTIYILDDSRKIFDRAIPSQKEAKQAFIEKWSAQLGV